MWLSIGLGAQWRSQLRVLVAEQVAISELERHNAPLNRNSGEVQVTIRLHRLVRLSVCGLRLRDMVIDIPPWVMKCLLATAR